MITRLALGVAPSLDCELRQSNSDAGVSSAFFFDHESSLSAFVRASGLSGSLCLKPMRSSNKKVLNMTPLRTVPVVTPKTASKLTTMALIGERSYRLVQRALHW